MAEEMQKIEQDFNIIKQSEQELRWYFMSASPVPVHPNTLVIPILSFDLDKAVEQVNLVKPPNTFISYSGNKLVKELLKEIVDMGYTLTGEPLPPHAIEEMPKITINISKEKTLTSFQQFIERLTLVAEDYCVDANDRLILLKILNKIKESKVEPSKILT